MVKYFDAYKRQVTSMIYVVAAIKYEVVVGHVPHKTRRFVRSLFDVAGT